MCSFFATESFTEMTSAINHLPMCNQQNEKITGVILYDNFTDELFKRLQTSKTFSLIYNFSHYIFSGVMYCFFFYNLKKLGNKFLIRKSNE